MDPRDDELRGRGTRVLVLYSSDRPFHMSWSPTPRGTVIRMVRKKTGKGLIPRVVVRGKPVAKTCPSRPLLGP